MKRALLEAVTLDAAGTLFHLRETVGSGYARVASTMGLKLDPDAVTRAFRRCWNAAPVYEPGAPEADDGKSWWRGLVFDILDALEIGALTEARREEYFEALYAHYASPEQWQLYPETMEVLELLASLPVLALGVISNFDGRLHGILSGLGIRSWFDRVTISSEVGFSKPHPRIFDAGWKDIASAAGRCLHVGDGPRADWKGAAGAGMQVFRLDRPKNDLRAVAHLVRQQ